MKTIQKYIYAVLILSFGITLFSCDDYLDKVPDTRVQLDTPQKVKDLLLTSYPKANHAWMCELLSDNIWDNRVPNELGTFLRANAYDRMDTSLFQWEDIKGQADNSQDSPFYLWQNYYNSIASVNLALEALDDLESSGVSAEELNLQRAEAHAIRAYCHYILVNVFAMPFRDFDLSKQDIGITYMRKPESVIGTKYERDNVSYVYERIIEDIETSLSYFRTLDFGSDTDLYSNPAYRFTKKGTHALAARVYLTVREYEKVVAHADTVLGGANVNPTSVLRDWKPTYNGPDQQAYAYFSSTNPANILILPTYSIQDRRLGAYRYGYMKDALKGSFNDKGPTWPTSRQAPHLVGWVWVYYGASQYNSMIPIVREFFEYTDKIARVGYPHVIRAEFTTDATLLDRAEAKVFLDDYTGAVRDLQYWNASHKSTMLLTEEDIRKFYDLSGGEDMKYFVFDFNTELMSPSFVVTEDQKPVIDCVLHFRRLERVMQGERWFDIKRYGIELTKIAGVNADTLFLPWNDPRRAVQIPDDVVHAGLEANPRPLSPNNQPVSPFKESVNE